MSGLLLDRILASLRRHPSKECMVLGDRRVTYGELGRQILAAGEVIRGQVDGDERVAVLMENSPEYVAACFGTWISGNTLVGLNPALKGEELARLVAHSGSRYLLLDPTHAQAEQLKGLLGPEVKIREIPIGGGFGQEPAGVAPPEAAGLQEELDPGALAAIVYTSGTTGHPKGVMLTHGALAANTESILQSLPVRAEDRVLCVLPFQYSYGASILHTHLAVGATLVLERSFLYPHVVLERMVKERVTTLPGVPSTFQILMRRTELSEYDLSSLRYVTAAGGPMAQGPMSEFLDLVPGVEFLMMYGQTEAAPRVTCLPAEDLVRKQGSAGKGIPGVELKILDDEGAKLGPGQVGEVCVRGENLMAGYWDDVEETTEVLKDGWLFTGDLGHLDEDGYLFLEGRLKEMIKSGAHRIAPAEIEEVIRGTPGVRDVVVTGWADDLLGQVPKAWVIPTGPESGLRQVILRECQTRLARFKVPRDVVFLQEFPRGPTGKVRRHLLGGGDSS